MIGALFTGITGLSSQQKALDNEANNIANVNTVGFKSSRISFADQMYQDRIGKGSKILDAEKLYTQGNLKITGVAYDMALSGEGFFTIKDNNTNENLFSRAGNFRMGDNGTLQDAAGNEVQGWMMVDIDTKKDVITTNPNVDVFTNDYNKLLASRIVKHSNYVETITAKATDYTATAMSDSESIFSGAGLKTKSAKISDIEEAIKDYTTWLQRLSEEPDGASAKSISQVSQINFKTGDDALVAKEGDQIYTVINGTKISQNYVQVSATDEFKESMLALDEDGALIDTGSITDNGSGTIAKLDITAENNTRYSLTINGTEVHYDSDTDATESEILAGLKAAIISKTSIGLDEADLIDDTQAISSPVDTQAASFTPGDKQLDTITISGTITAGDTFNINFGGQDYTYTATSTNVDDVAAGLAALINGATDGTTTLTATATGSGELTLESDIDNTDPETTFTATVSTISSTDPSASIASVNTTPATAAVSTNTPQIQEVTISGTIESGDAFTINFGGVSYTYKAESGNTADDVAAGLATLIDGKSDGTNTLTAVASTDGSGTVTLTTDQELGQEFTITTAVANTESSLTFDTANATGTPSVDFKTYNSIIKEPYDVAASRIETYRQLADKISEIPGLKAYMVKEDDAQNGLNFDAFDEKDEYFSSTFNRDMYYGQIQIEALIPGKEFTISEVAEVSGTSVIQGNYQTSTAAEAGSGIGALDSSSDALSRLITGNQRDVYTLSDLELNEGGTKDFTYGLTIYDKTLGQNVPVPNDGGIPLQQGSILINDASSIDEIVAAINDRTTPTFTFEGTKLSTENTLPDYIVAKNVNGALVIETLDDRYDAEFAGVLKVAADNTVDDGSVDLTGNYTPKDVNNNYSGRAGAGAEFLQLITKVDQTASKGSLQLRLDTLGISDSAFGEFSVDSAGLITMKQDGADFAIGQVAIAVFNNNRGLDPVGDNLLAKTTESGEAFYNLNNDKTAKIEGKTLELSSADLSESLVNLMVFQRAFEANAKSITTSDELLNTLINLKR